MEDGNTIRKLRAIMFSDIVGYSIMMQTNETEALKLLQKHKEIVEEVSEKYGGKIIKFIGDEILVESESAVMLVYCAKELQKRLTERNTTVPKSRELWVRIGIHIGDVIMKEDDIFGDGVNIAARIRPIANPGGIVITHSVLILLGNQDDIKCTLIGNKKLKNIKEKVKVYEVMPDSTAIPASRHESKLFWVRRDVFTKVILPIFLILFLGFLTFFLIAFDKITEYEIAFFKCDYNSSYEETLNFRSLKNIKNNYFNIVSAEEKRFGEVLKYYRSLYNNNQTSPKANFYLGLAYLKHNPSRALLDSSYIFISKAEDMGLGGMYFTLTKMELYEKLSLRPSAVALADELIKNYPEEPLASVKAANIYWKFCNDSKTALRLYRSALSSFPQFTECYVGLSEIEYSGYNYNKAKQLADSALTISPQFLPGIRTALKINKCNSSIEEARKALSVLPIHSLFKYIEHAKISMFENEPSNALNYISDGLSEFPDNNQLIEMNQAVTKIITLSDSIQQKENSISKGRIKWFDNWETVVQTSMREKKPVIYLALDNESLSSKYLENVITRRELVKLMNETIPIKLYKYKDRQLLDSLDVNHFPAIIMTDLNKNVLRTFTNKAGNITDTEVIRSFITECLLLNRRLNSLEEDSEYNKFKTARNFSHAEELALENELPVMVVVTSKFTPYSESYMKQTIFHPAFMDNLKRMVLLTVDETENQELVKKYHINKFPTVLFFDEDINLISRKYGVMPRNILSEEIDKVKLYRKRRDIIKEEINWIFDLDEAISYARNESKPIFVYHSKSSSYDKYPEEDIFENNEVIKRINTDFIPLVLKNDMIFAENNIKYSPVVAVLNCYGDLIYSSDITKKDLFTMNFLDYNYNKDMFVNLGAENFKYYFAKNNQIASLVENKIMQSAEKEILNSLIKYPTNAYAIYELANIFMNNNLMLKAEHYLEFLENKKFTLTENYIKTVVSTYMLYDDFNRLVELMNLYLKLFKSDNIALSILYSALSEINLAQSLTIDAISYAEKASSIDPHNEDILLLLGLLNFNINKTESEKFFRSVLIIDPKNPLANSYIFNITGDKRYAITAKQSFYSGKDDLSGLRFFDNSRHFLNPGIIELKDRSLRIRTSMFPDNLEYKNSLAKFITDSNGDMAEALEITNQILESEPDNPDYLDTAALVFYSLGDYSGADKLVTKALRNLSPEEYSMHPDLFYHTGVIKSAIGDNRSAGFYFDKFVNFKEIDNIDLKKMDYAKRFLESIY